MNTRIPAAIMPVPSMLSGCPQQNTIRTPIPASVSAPAAMLMMILLIK
jgi:hypothetical protein